ELPQVTQPVLLLHSRQDHVVDPADSARILDRTFLTLSAWEDPGALPRFARSEPHRSSSRAAAAFMRESAFTFWTVPASALPIGWAEAEHRLAEEAARPGRAA
ncbi:DUF3291 domain-containing protein, partial [Streptomyces roseus]|uniref:DUF3291 domain-containing protein n=1 Tax=Streptomyces roseus TaxID=66430 RepID=UPI00131E9452